LIRRGPISYTDRLRHWLHRHCLLPCEIRNCMQSSIVPLTKVEGTCKMFQIAIGPQTSHGRACGAAWLKHPNSNIGEVIDLQACKSCPVDVRQFQWSQWCLQSMFFSYDPGCRAVNFLLKSGILD